MSTTAKTILTRTLGAALLCVLVMGMMLGLATVRQINLAETVQAQDGSLQRQLRCSEATLEGRYAYVGHGFVPGGPPPAPLVPFGVSGIMTMDGAGTLSNNATASNNGQIVQGGVSPGIYTVNPDCTGTITLTIPVPPFQLTFNLYMADIQGSGQGTEFYFIGTTPSVVTHTANRIQ